MRAALIHRWHRRGWGRRRPAGRKLIPAALLAVALTGLAACGTGLPPSPSPAPTAAAKPGHVFVINLENKSFRDVWNDQSDAEYLSQTLRPQGVLLSRYYAIGHASLPNYIAQISGQGPNSATKGDCPVYETFDSSGTASLGQEQGSGCVYPESVQTVAGQLSAAGKTWKGYMEDMGTPCLHPELGADDPNHAAQEGDQYATRHNPFVYFAGITSSPECERNDVGLSSLSGDLKTVATTANLSYISPNLCNDGHDSPCVDGREGGLVSADVWLRKHVPEIMASPAYKQDGMLVITFDEAEGKESADAALPGGAAGGLIGTLVLSPLARAGATSDRLYNHYSLLASIEDVFGLPYLGYAAAPGLNRFGADVFSR
ncbi:alkaline phosphatase family protein [Arthrobacter sp. NPDC056691]|uniref:alkaline phosphatase family protein n=1 Tax=Arthrobacter sp. NPDC056691 TaxID=3345913 RepID=UPI00366AA8AD